MLNGQVIFIYPGVEGNPGLITSAEFKAAIAFKPKGLLVVAAVRMPSGGALRFYLASVRPTPSFNSMNVIKLKSLNSKEWDAAASEDESSSDEDGPDLGVGASSDEDGPDLGVGVGFVMVSPSSFLTSSLFSPPFPPHLFFNSKYALRFPVHLHPLPTSSFLFVSA